MTKEINLPTLPDGSLDWDKTWILATNYRLSANDASFMSVLQAIHQHGRAEGHEEVLKLCDALTDGETMYGSGYIADRIRELKP